MINSEDYHTMTSATESPAAKKRVIILGGGFAGVQAAIELQKEARFAVTLVSDRSYLFLFPISIWIPTREISFEQAQVPLSEIQEAYGFSLVIDSIRDIRSATNTVVCEHTQLSYDYLIVALGASRVSQPGIEHTMSICGKPETSLAIRDRLDHLIEKKNGSIAVGFGGNPKDKSAVRGGPAFELLFNIDTLLRRKGIRDRFTLSFFAPMPSPGERMGRKALAAIDRMLKSASIQKRVGKKITAFDEQGVAFEDGARLDADLVLFIPGTAGHDAVRRSDLPLNEAGFVRIDDHGLVHGTTNVFAAGDVSALEGPEWRAKQGHTAEVMARNAVFNILAIEDGKTERHGYQKDLSIMCLMDTGTGAALVFRDGRKEFMVPLAVGGHWMKKLWGNYARRTKTGRFPRLPGL
jgi:sulfide:quinone oxidoreductase